MPEITDAEKREKVLRRVRSMLDFENDSHAATEDEKQAMMAQAASLMMRYAITEDEVREAAGGNRPDVITFTHEVDGTGGFGVARALAYGRVANAMGARTFYVGNGGSKVLFLTVFCHDDMRDAITMIFASMTPVMTQGALAAGEAAKRRSYGDRTARYHGYKSYVEGFGTGLAHRILELSRPTPDQGTSTSLVLVRRSDEIDAAYSQTSTKPRAQTRRTDAVAREDGIRDGRRFGDPKLGSTSSQPALG